MSSSSSSSPSSSSSAPTPQYKVEVWLYDLTQGMARQLSLPFLGKQIDGIWHTGVVVYGWEYFYGGGIQTARPGTTLAGQPMRKIDMGYTSIPQQAFHSFLHSVSHRFTPQTYSLLSHNCNNFTHEAVRFLTNTDMPAYITGLPEEVFSTPLGAMLRPMIMNMEQQFRSSQGGGLIPWSVDLLDLPPCTAKPDRYHTVTQEEQKQIAADSKPVAERVSAPATSILAGTASTHPHHPHASLPLTVLSASSKPLLSSDKKTTAFWALMKAYIKKVSPDKRLTDDDHTVLEKVVEAMGNDKDIPTDQETKAIDIFDQLLHTWPAELLFPVLALLRLFVLRPTVAQYYMEKKDDNGVELVNKLLALIPTAPMAAQSMALCIIANLFATPAFAAQLTLNTSLVDACRTALHSAHESVRVMAATVLYNMSLCLPKDDSDEVIEVTSTLAEHTQEEKDAETVYRCLLCLGHLLYGNSSAALLCMSMDWEVEKIVSKFTSNKNIQNVSKDIELILRHEREAMAVSPD